MLKIYNYHLHKNQGMDFLSKWEIIIWFHILAAGGLWSNFKILGIQSINKIHNWLEN